jgi:predicted DNA-binding transcriptional regulator AlpA
MNRPIDPDTLITVQEAAQEFDMGESTAWLLIRRQQVPRYRRPGFGKRTFVRRQDFKQAYRTPVSVPSEQGKAVAA